jgi:hypothetical protein
VDSNGLTLVEPVTIRTGKGSIDVAAGNDVSLFDTSRVADPSTLIIPGVIYTAGAPAAGAPPVGLTTAIAHGNVAGLQDVLVTSAVNPDSAGDITIHARRDIKGMQKVIDANGTVTGNAGNSIDQYWWQWMQITGAKTADGNTRCSAGPDLDRFRRLRPGRDERRRQCLAQCRREYFGSRGVVADHLVQGRNRPARHRRRRQSVGTRRRRHFERHLLRREGAGVISAGGSIGSDIAVPVSIPGKLQ